MSFLPANYEEVERIYNLTFGNGHKSVAVTSVNPKEGKTSIALTLAHRNLLAGQSTLVVDLSSHNPCLIPILDDLEVFEPLEEFDNSSVLETDIFNKNLVNTIPLKTDCSVGHEKPNPELLSEVLSEDRGEVLGVPQLITARNSEFVLTGVVFPKKTKNIMELRKPGVLDEHIMQWFKSFDAVVFDTSPIKNVNESNIPVNLVLNACDIGVLVVLASQTKDHELFESLKKLGEAKQKIKGIVVNDQFNPSLKNELLRQIDKLSNHFSWIKKVLAKFINKRQFLKITDY